MLTLGDAAEYITARPKAEQDAATGRDGNAVLVAERDGPEKLARIAVMKALNRTSPGDANAVTETGQRCSDLFWDRPVNSRDKNPRPRIATMHCATV